MKMRPKVWIISAAVVLCAELADCIVHKRLLVLDVVVMWALVGWIHANCQVMLLLKRL